MALETSLERPAPVRQIANAISQRVDRLGTVWVVGQVAQFIRRQGMNTVFLTLDPHGAQPVDPLGDRVRDLPDRCRPLEGGLQGHGPDPRGRHLRWGA